MMTCIPKSNDNQDVTFICTNGNGNGNGNGNNDTHNASTISSPSVSSTITNRTYTGTGTGTGTSRGMSRAVFFLLTISTCINVTSAFQFHHASALTISTSHQYSTIHNNRGITTSSSALPLPLPHIKQPSSHLYMIKRRRGRKGKPASSKEDDLEKTIANILKHEQKLIGDTNNNVIDDVIVVNGSANATLRTNQQTIQTRDIKSISSSSLMDKILSTLTSAFPLFVLSSAIIGVKQPQLLNWVNNGSIIPVMLGAVMTFMGMTLSTQDFKNVVSPQQTSQSSSSSSSSNDDANTNNASSISAVPIGILCQYIIMPFTAYIIGSTLLLPSQSAAFLGLILVGCSPGGTASNLVALIAKADVALSIILTSASTLFASILTPLLVKTIMALAGTSATAITVSGMVLCKATAQVIVGPIVLGMTIRRIIPNIANAIGKYASFAGVILVSLLCGGVVAQNASLFQSAAVAGSSGGQSIHLIRNIIWSVLGLHMVGFSVGYFSPRKIFGFSERTSRTISIETGMQNSALAVVLAKSVIMAMDVGVTGRGEKAVAAAVQNKEMLMSMAMLPGAISATAHSCLGSALAVYWRYVDGRRGLNTKRNEEDGDADGKTVSGVEKKGNVKRQRYGTDPNSGNGIEGTNVFDESDGSGI